MPSPVSVALKDTRFGKLRYPSSNETPEKDPLTARSFLSSPSVSDRSHIESEISANESSLLPTPGSQRSKQIMKIISKRSEKLKKEVLFQTPTKDPDVIFKEEMNELAAHFERIKTSSVKKRAVDFELRRLQHMEKYRQMKESNGTAAIIFEKEEITTNPFWLDASPQRSGVSQRSPVGIATPSHIQPDDVEEISEAPLHNSTEIDPEPAETGEIPGETASCRLNIDFYDLLHEPASLSPTNESINEKIPAINQSSQPHVETPAVKENSPEIEEIQDPPSTTDSETSKAWNPDPKIWKDEESESPAADLTPPAQSSFSVPSNARKVPSLIPKSVLAKRISQENAGEKSPKKEVEPVAKQESPPSKRELSPRSGKSPTESGSKPSFYFKCSDAVIKIVTKNGKQGSSGHSPTENLSPQSAETPSTSIKTEPGSPSEKRKVHEELPIQVRRGLVPSAEKWKEFQGFKARVAKTDAICDEFREENSRLAKDLKMTVKQIVNRISGYSVRENFDELQRLLRGGRILGGAMGTQHIAIRPGNPEYTWTLHLIAEAILNQASNNCSLPELESVSVALYPLSSVTISLIAASDDFRQLFLAKTIISCPWLLPYYDLEKASSLEQECGMIRLFAAVCVSSPVQGSRVANPFGTQAIWQLLATISNMKPSPLVTETLCLELISVSGFFMLRTYGNQFTKLCQCLRKQLLPKLKATSTANPLTHAAYKRLENLLQNLRFQKPVNFKEKY